jgi:hypothetical protein
MAWSDVESGLISYARISLVIFPAEKQRSITDGDVPFRESVLACQVCCVGRNCVSPSSPQ